MAESTWAYLKQRFRRTGGLTLREDGGIAAATVALALGFLDRQTATEKAIDAVGYGLGAAMVYQLARWAVRFLFTVPREMHNDLLAEKDLALARVAALEAHRPVASDDWMDMAKEFRSVEDFGVYGITSLAGGQELWEIHGYIDTGRQLRALCKRAGAMLLMSPRVAAGLSPKVRQVHDPVSRWFELLKEQPYVEANITPFTGMDKGTPIRNEKFEKVGTLSAAVCMNCSAEEV
jgi:hypothetical protein